MFDDDGLWPCKCNACEHEWYSSIAAMRADAEAICPACGESNFISLAEFDSALVSARTGTYDFSYLVRIPPQFRFGASLQHKEPVDFVRS
jgi:hypothetical protein